MSAHVHKLIKKTAEEMAESVYEDIMRDNTVYANWKKICPDLTPKLARKEFVRLLWPKLVKDARATLASMLGGNYSEHLKKEIHEALIMDHSLQRGKSPPRTKVTLN